MASRRITPLSAAGVSSLLGGLAAALIGTSAGAAVIVEIEVKADSQSRLSRPAYDKTFRVVASAGFLNHDLGIGIIANPTVVNANDDRDFALHQDREPNSTLYSNHVPDPASSTVYFRFDAPTVVDYVEIVQHFYGATKVGGAAGNDRNALTPVGSVFGPLGDVVSGVLGLDGTIHKFDLNPNGVAGLWFAVSIDKGNYPTAYAIHRAWLYDDSGIRIAAAVPEPSTYALLLGGLALLGAFARRRR